MVGAHPRTSLRSLFKKSKNSACSIPLYTFIYELLCLQSGKFSNKLVYTQYQYKEQTPSLLNKCQPILFLKKYILWWHQNFQFTT